MYKHLKRAAKALRIKNKRSLHAHLDSPANGFAHPLGRELPMVFSGWAFFDDQPAVAIKYCIDSQLLAVKEMNFQRPDVRNVFVATDAFSSPLGFKHSFPIGKDLTPGSHKLEVQVRAQSADWQIMKSIQFQAIDSNAMSFSERYSCIPAYLVYKVNGSLDEKTYRQIGDRIAQLVRKVEVLNHARDVLDFGCGLGRVLRPLSQALPAVHFSGFDVDSSMIAWCEFLVNDPRYEFSVDSKAFAGNSFDFIYAISVFTHLDESADYWFSEIKRLLRPKGCAFITYHDDTLFSEKAGTNVLPEVAEGAKLNDYYVVGRDSVEGDAVMGTWYTTRHWEERVKEHFELLETKPRGLDGYQSFSIVRA